MRKRGALLLGAAAVLVLAAIAARSRSAVDYGPPPAVPTGGAVAPASASASVLSRLPPSVQPNGIIGAGIAVVLVVIVLGVLLALVLGGLLLARYGRRGEHSVRSADGEQSAGLLNVTGADVLGGGATAALVELRRQGAEPADAVQAAWLRLEEAAERGGSARRPEQTATEFTVALLRAHRVPAEPLAVLRGLYLRARFGDPVTITDTDVAAAIAATERIVHRLTSGARDD